MKVFRSAVYRAEKKVEKVEGRPGMYVLRNVRSSSYDYFRTPERIAKKAAGKLKLKG